MAFEDGVFATFYDEAVENKSETRAQGHPVFTEAVYVKIMVPNQVDCVPRPMQDKDKTRFPKSWEAYETGKEPADTGFPLEHWPQLTVGELKVCQANQIKTVEQLASIADSGLHRLGQGGTDMKVRAQRLVSGVGQAEELKKENAELLKRIEALESGATPIKKRKRLKVS